jgi:hypothetical protein
VVIYGIFDEVSDFLRRRAPKNPPSRGFFCPFSDVLLFLWISSWRSSAGDSAVAIRGRGVEAQIRTLSDRSA